MTMRETIFQAARLSRPKHGRDRSFHGSLVAIKPAPLGDKLLLLALAEVQGPKLGLIKGVFRLRSQQTGPLRDDLILLAPDSVEGFHRGADEGFPGGADDGVRKLHPGALGYAGLVSLSVLSQGGEGIKRIATTMLPEVRHSASGRDPTSMQGPKGWFSVPAKSAVSISEVDR